MIRCRDEFCVPHQSHSTPSLNILPFVLAASPCSRYSSMARITASVFAVAVILALAVPQETAASSYMVKMRDGVELFTSVE